MKTVITVFLLLCGHLLLAQGFNEGYRRNWVYTTRSKVRQNSSASPTLTPSSGGTLLSEGTASISDDEGVLLFYTDGMTVYNRNNVQMDNGFGLASTSNCAQPAVIVPKPGGGTLYYIFTTRDWFNANNGLCYSIVDMSLNGGLGKVITKNVLVQNGVYEQIAAIRKPCLSGGGGGTASSSGESGAASVAGPGGGTGGRDYWIVSHEINSNNYIAYLLTPSGLSGPVRSSIGDYVNAGGSSNRYGCIKFAHNRYPYTRNMVSVLGGVTGLGNTPTTVELCDFDPNTGKITGVVPLSTSSSVYGAEFSPDNTKLYVTSLGTTAIKQYNIAGTMITEAAVGNTSTNIIRGPGDILFINTQNNSRVQAITNPNAAAASLSITTACTLPGSAGIGTDNFYAVSGCAGDYTTVTIPCTNCIPSFAPPRGRQYIISAWVKEAGAPATKTSYTNPQITFTYVNSSGVSGPYGPKGRIIDGWQRIEETFTIPAAATDMIISLNSLSGDVYVDDIRIYPLDGSCKTYVYDPATLRLSAELDENNYATFYEYDEEGRLVRVKKETAEGIMTIQENRVSQPKR